MERKVLLIDMNAFFAAVEQQCNPFLRGRPVLVGGASSRSVVAAASYEARAFGIKSGMPLGKARRLCPTAIVIEGDLPKYVDTARRLQELFLQFSSRVEIFSIDEAFLELSPQENPLAVARAVKGRMRAQFGLTCSIGVGPNKRVAKLAAGLQKPDGLVWIRPEEFAARTASLPVAELCGIGPKLEKRLHTLGIWTIAQLGGAPRALLRTHFGAFWGELLADMGQGIDSSPVVSCFREPVVKSMGHSHTLAHNTTSLPELRAYLLTLSLLVGRRLRADGYAGRTVRLTVRTANFTTLCRHQTFPHWLNHGQQIYQNAWRLFAQLPWPGPVRMLGVAVANLVKGAAQGELFSDYEKTHSLRQAEDAILDRFGEFALKPASLLVVRPRTNETRLF